MGAGMRAWHRRVAAAITAAMTMVLVCAIAGTGAAQSVTAQTILKSYVVVVGGTGDSSGWWLRNQMQESKIAETWSDPAATTMQVHYPASIFGNDSDATSLTTSVNIGMANLLAALKQIPAAQDVRLVGASQGSIVISQALTSMKDQIDGLGLNMSLLLMADETRPNGGLLTRFPNLDLLPFLNLQSPPGPEYGDIPVTNVALQYDGFSDFPAHAGLLAIVNAALGLLYYRHPGPDVWTDPNDPSNIYPGYPSFSIDNPNTADVEETTPNTTVVKVGNYTDVLLHAPHLPLLQPIRDLAFALHMQNIVIPLLDAVEPVLQTVIETSYDRGDPAARTRFSMLPPVENVIKTVLNLPGAAQRGFENFVNDVNLIMRGKTPDSPLRYPPNTTAQQGIDDWQGQNSPFEAVAATRAMSRKVAPRVVPAELSTKTEDSHDEPAFGGGVGTSGSDQSTSSKADRRTRHDRRGGKIRSSLESVAADSDGSEKKSSGRGRTRGHKPTSSPEGASAQASGTDAAQSKRAGPRRQASHSGTHRPRGTVGRSDTAA